MYISLGGNGPQFTNKLFNTIEIEPFSYVCMTNISIKKDENITVGDPLQIFFYANYNNIYKFEIPTGEYSIDALAVKFNEVVTDKLERFKLSASIKVEPGNTRRFVINIKNNVQQALNFGILPEDDTGKPFDQNYNRVWGPGIDAVDIAGMGTFKDTGPNVANQGYIGVAQYQNHLNKNPSGNQTLGIVGYQTLNGPLYVAKNLTGVPVGDFDATDPTVNFQQNSMVQATYQFYDDYNIPPTQFNDNDEDLSAQWKTADLNRFSGVISFVACSQGSNKDVVICTGAESDDGGTSTNYPVDFSDFTVPDENKKLWIKWFDPREIANKNIVKFGYWGYDNSTQVKDWRNVEAKVPDEEKIALEGNKWTIEFEKNTTGDTPYVMYHPKVTVDHLEYKSSSLTKDIYSHVIAFWDMDVPLDGPPDSSLFFKSDHTAVSGQFKSTAFYHCGYDYLWNNIGASWDGSSVSGHYFGTEYNQAEVDDGYNKGSGFELRTGSGSIDFQQSSGILETPGYYNTAFGVSRTSSSGATGYKNAYYKFADTFGGKLGRSDDGNIFSVPEGLILPMTPSVRTIGSYYMSVCFRMDDSSITDYQIIYAYEGSDPVTGVATDPHVMLGVKIGSDTILCGDGGTDAGDREEISVTEVDTGAAYTFNERAWYNIAIVFQKMAGPGPSAWKIIGIDEDGTAFEAMPSCTRTPTKPVFGLGGNNICNGTQTVSTGFVGVMKLWKLGFIYGNDITSGANFDDNDLLKLCCSDMTGEKDQSNIDDWNYTNQCRSTEVFSESIFTDTFWGIGQPDAENPLTLVMGAYESGTSPKYLAAYNPYDALFTACIWRQNFLTDLDKRYVDNVDQDAIMPYLAKGAKAISLDQCGFINFNVGGLDALGYDGDLQLVDLKPLNISNLGDLVAQNVIDTEIGLNDNRIHIDNLPIQSYNGIVGSMDRAIYQTGSVQPVRETGQNYVNNTLNVPQKIWIPLKNAGSLHLNEFNTKITDLQGKIDDEVISAQLNIEIKNKEEMIYSK